jgi:outer membrane protein TolC
MIAAGALACAGSSGPGYRALEDRLAEQEAAAPQAAADRPFAGHPTLERAPLVAEVLRRNPSLAAARSAWRAALARYPQETALEDPMVGYSIGPRTIGSSTVMQEAHRFEVSQAIPFPGKLALRGAAALAEAEAAAEDYEAARVQLAAMASLLYDEAWLLDRAAAINGEHLALVRELREIAVARYESGEAEQQDPLRAEVEEAMLLHREVEIETGRRVVRQQIAALLHLRDGASLPPLPDELAPASVEEPDAAADEALPERPELRAAEARVRARESAEALARRERLPDLRLMGSYDRSWNETDMRPMVGVELNVPLQWARREAAIDEAQATLEQARHERARMEDDVAVEVATARERLAEARHLLALTRDRTLPAARDQLTAARIGFETGRVMFSDVIEAERLLRDAELGAEQALADASRRAAELAAALGRVPGAAAPSPAPDAAHEAHHE